MPMTKKQEKRILTYKEHARLMWFLYKETSGNIGIRNPRDSLWSKSYTSSGPLWHFTSLEKVLLILESTASWSTSSRRFAWSATRSGVKMMPPASRMTGSLPPWSWTGSAWSPSVSSLLWPRWLCWPRPPTWLSSDYSLHVQKCDLLSIYWVSISWSDDPIKWCKHIYKVVEDSCTLLLIHSLFWMRFGLTEL